MAYGEGFRISGPRLRCIAGHPSARYAAGRGKPKRLRRIAQLGNHAIMGSFRTVVLTVLAALALPATEAFGQSPPTRAAAEGAKQSSTMGEVKPEGVPNGKKLVLKDGSFHVVRSYERSADRVRNSAKNQQRDERDVKRELAYEQPVAKSERDTQHRRSRRRPKRSRHRPAAGSRRSTTELSTTAATQFGEVDFSPPTRNAVPLCSGGKRSPRPCSLLRSEPPAYSAG